MRKLLFLTIFLIPFYSLSNVPVDESSLQNTINNCNNVIQTTELGTNIDYFDIPYHQPSIVRAPARFLNDGKKITILFCRTGWIADNTNTDDEYTPLIFVDGILSAVGWEILGGPRTYGDRRAMERQRQWEREQVDRQNQGLKMLCNALGGNCNW